MPATRPPECTSAAPFLPRFHFIGKPSSAVNPGTEGAGHFPDNANDANALFWHGGYLHAMHQTVRAPTVLLTCPCTPYGH